MMALGDLIRRSIVAKLGNDSKGQFLPKGDMERLMSIEAVEEIIAQAHGNSPDYGSIDVRREIFGVDNHQKRIKILTILLLIEEPGYIGRFISHDVFDVQLPLKPKARIFQGWRPAAKYSFLNQQHMVLAPVLDFTDKGHHIFTSGAPMPFLNSLEWNNQGCHGQVSKVQIHEQHQHWGERSASKAHDSCYAIKKFPGHANDNFEKERRALLRFTGPEQRHDNLIELLLSYGRKQSQYLIFPWADGNLQDYWKRTHNDPRSRQHVARLIRQCQGLADGLCQVHEYHYSAGVQTVGSGASFTWSQNRGRHGDIKPQNILYFADGRDQPERLVIADFTLMRFHTATIGKTYASQVGFSKSHRPPEVHKGKGAKVSQKYDIWTLGCVYLEFVTWHLLGYDAIYEKSFQAVDQREYESFSTVRQSDDDKPSYLEDKFFNTTGLGPVVKPSVKRWIKFLYRHPDCSPAIRTFLSFIETHMLLTESTKRCRMYDVRNKLVKISTACETSDKYASPCEPSSSILRRRRRLPPLFSEKSMYGRVFTNSLIEASTTPGGRSNSDQEVIRNAFQGSDEDPIPTLGHEESRSRGRFRGQYLSIPEDDYRLRRGASSDSLSRSNSSDISTGASRTPLSSYCSASPDTLPDHNQTSGDGDLVPGAAISIFQTTSVVSYN